MSRAECSGERAKSAVHGGSSLLSAVQFALCSLQFNSVVKARAGVL